MSTVHVTTPTKSHLPVSQYESSFHSPIHQPFPQFAASSASRRSRPLTLASAVESHNRKSNGSILAASNHSHSSNQSTTPREEPKSVFAIPDDEDFAMADSSPIRFLPHYGSYRGNHSRQLSIDDPLPVSRPSESRRRNVSDHPFTVSMSAPNESDISPIKRPNFSSSKSLGRAPGVPNSLARSKRGPVRSRPLGGHHSTTQSRETNVFDDEDDDDDDDAIFSNGSSEGLSELSALKLGMGNPKDVVEEYHLDDSDEDDEGFSPPSKLQPLSFLPSPSPFLTTSLLASSTSSSQSSSTASKLEHSLSSSSRSPSENYHHHRALTEHELNIHLPKSTSYQGPSKNLIAEDPFLSVSTERRPRSSTHTAFTIPPPSPTQSRSASRMASHGNLFAPHARYLTSSASSASAVTGGQTSLGVTVSKKAVSLDDLSLLENGLTGQTTVIVPPASPFVGSASSKTLSRARPGKHAPSAQKAFHKRTNSNDYNQAGPAQHVSRMLPSGSVKPLPSSFSHRAVHNSNTASVGSTGISQSTSLFHLPSSNSASHLSSTSSAATAIPTTHHATRSESVLNRSAPASLRESDSQPFDDAKPLLAAFQAKSSLSKKFKPRDSGVALSETSFTDSPGGQSFLRTSGTMMPPPLPRRTSGGTLSRLQTSTVPSFSQDDAWGGSADDDDANFGAVQNRFDGEMSLEELVTPSCEISSNGWPSILRSNSGINNSLSTSSERTSIAGGPASSASFDFLGAEAAEVLATAVAAQHGSGGMKIMPDTPVKRSTSSFALGGSHGGGNGGVKASGGGMKPHPLSIADSVDAIPSSPSAESPSAQLQHQHQNLSHEDDHHSSNVLAQSHRPSQGQPPHLLGHAPQSCSKPIRSLVPRRSQTFKPSSFNLSVSEVPSSSSSSSSSVISPIVSGSKQTTKATLGSTSSSPLRAGDSPTFLRRSNLMLIQPVSSPSVRPSSFGSPSLAPSGLPTRTMLKRTSSGVMSGSESESGSGVEMTPTKGLGARARPLLGSKSQGSPTKIPQLRRKTISSLTTAGSASQLYAAHSPSLASTVTSAHPGSAVHSNGSFHPRLSLPSFAPSPAHGKRTLHHRSSHPINMRHQEDEDVFEIRFKVLEPLGQGAFSQVWKVQDRKGKSVWAVKRTKGVFEGVKDRLRHLEEVDILRTLSNPTNPHVIEFIDAWEQNRQLFIQTELCELGNLAFFLEEYGRVVERLDEGRVWKIVRELSDGLNHIHSQQILHLDLKPANILITTLGALKIGDFGLSTRSPRADPAAILRGAGLGGEVPSGTVEKGWEREGDRDYMALETMNGEFGKPADIFSFGLMLLEIATNIIVPANDEPWHALRSDDFSDVDLTPLSPALVDVITLCMRANPGERPGIADLVGHPMVARARSGKEALVPEPETFINMVLTGSSETIGGPCETLVEDMDVEMLG
ncbi:myt1 kinase [Phaffia rhodozyma]|uniref:Myt1 kinase n=1 Tax=Phaffia rhodozyma TaxID=264483 RepID=A0A0F7SLN3_PHARH|nr:myt1 kinase [Phaffia rhodozyma]